VAGATHGSLSRSGGRLIAPTKRRADSGHHHPVEGWLDVELPHPRESRSPGQPSVCAQSFVLQLLSRRRGLVVIVGLDQDTDPAVPCPRARSTPILDETSNTPSLVRGDDVAWKPGAAERLGVPYEQRPCVQE